VPCSVPAQIALYGIDSFAGRREGSVAKDRVSGPAVAGAAVLNCWCCHSQADTHGFSLMFLCSLFCSLFSGFPAGSILCRTQAALRARRASPVPPRSLHHRRTLHRPSPQLLHRLLAGLQCTMQPHRYSAGAAHRVTRPQAALGCLATLHVRLCFASRLQHRPRLQSTLAAAVTIRFSGTFDLNLREVIFTIHFVLGSVTNMATCIQIDARSSVFLSCLHFNL
jgi:hypothetical protein